MRAVATGANNDLLFEDGHLVIVEDSEAVAQHARQTLQTHHGEWFLDPSVGLPWLAQVLGYNPDTALAESVVKAGLKRIPGVLSVTEFSVRFNISKRELENWRLAVETTFGEEIGI